MQDDYLRIRKLEAVTSPYQTDFEKKIQMLPQPIKFIKKYLYFNFLPKVDKLIHDLEIIKESPNYEEKITKLKPTNLIKVGAVVTCFDMFDTHNIKHMKTSKIVYGTASGSIAIYDIEVNKLLLEKTVGKGRVENVSTVTVRYFDTYSTRLAVTIRGDSIVYFFTYNHSFALLTSESVLNLKDSATDSSNLNLSSLVASVKFSKDSFYVSIVDWAGGLRIFKFNDIPHSSGIKETNVSQNNLGNTFKKESMMVLSFQSKADKKSSVTDVNSQNQISNNMNNMNPPVLVSYLKYKEIENFTIINIKKEEENKNKKESQKVAPVKPAAKPAVKDTKNNIQPNVIPIIDENCYNVQPEIDENGNDFTPQIKYHKYHPLFTFVQKKFIFEEKSTGGFSSCLLTVGIYLGFYNTNSFKFVSLYSHLTENMKNSFKVVKTKGSSQLTAEESMSLSSSMAKKEKEYLSFIKSKLEGFNPGINQINSNQNSGLSSNKKGENQISSISLNSTLLTNIETKTEINFTTVFPISSLIGQKIFSNQNNLIAVGMKEGSILIWDAELHVKKFLFQDQNKTILSLSIDENLLMSGSIDGKVHIYDLVEGKAIHDCYHNPHSNFPIQSVQPLFPFMSVVLDTEEKLCLYNNKEKEKCGKILLESGNKNYNLAYNNKFILSFSDDYLLLACVKDKSIRSQPSLIDFIKFQKIQNKQTLKEFEDSQSNFINYFQNSLRNKNTKTYLLIYKVKEMIVKCYPQLAMVQKKGYSLKKILEKYEMNNVPTFNRDRSSLGLWNEEKKHDKKLSTSSLVMVDERTELSLIKKDSSVKMTDNTFNEDDIKNMKINLENRKSSQEAREDTDVGKGRKGQLSEQSSQKKNIFYFSFKNIRDRYQYKEQRVNKIQMRNEKIAKSLSSENNTLKKNK